MLMSESHKLILLVQTIPFYITRLIVPLAIVLSLFISLCSSSLGVEMSSLRNTAHRRDGPCGLSGRDITVEERVPSR